MFWPFLSPMWGHWLHSHALHCMYFAEAAWSANVVSTGWVPAHVFLSEWSGLSAPASSPQTPPPPHPQSVRATAQLLTQDSKQEVTAQQPNVGLTPTEDVQGLTGNWAKASHITSAFLYRKLNIWALFYCTLLKPLTIMSTQMYFHQGKLDNINVTSSVCFRLHLQY